MDTITLQQAQTILCAQTIPMNEHWQKNSENYWLFHFPGHAELGFTLYKNTESVNCFVIALNPSTKAFYRLGDRADLEPKWFTDAFKGRLMTCYSNGGDMDQGLFRDWLKEILDAGALAALGEFPQARQLEPVGSHKFPSLIAEFDNQSCSKTVGTVRRGSFTRAQVEAAQVGRRHNVEINIIGAYAPVSWLDVNKQAAVFENYKSTLEVCPDFKPLTHQYYVGLDNRGDFWLYKLKIVKGSWDGLYGDATAGIPLEYQTEFCWEHVGHMGNLSNEEDVQEVKPYLDFMLGGLK